MIRHIVAWKLKATEPAEKEEAARRLAVGLQELVPIIPEIQHLTVGADLGVVDGNWDVALWVDFASLADLDSYQSHPAHVAFAALPRELTADRVCVDLDL